MFITFGSLISNSAKRRRTGCSMSALGHKRTSRHLFDYLVGASKKRGGHGDTESSPLCILQACAQILEESERLTERTPEPRCPLCSGHGDLRVKCLPHTQRPDQSHR